jgi:hypothetical protein
MSVYNNSNYTYEMPSPSYEMNKKHIYRYRETHLDKVRQINRESKRRYDAWKRIQREFLNILL